MRKYYWLERELGAVAPQLRAAIPQLRAEFLAHHTDYDGEFRGGVPYRNPVEGNDVAQLQTQRDAWQVDPLKYTWAAHGEYHTQYQQQEVRARFPTACAIMDWLGDDSPIATYSSLEPHSSILRHEGGENETGEIIRIHVPLIIPPGDIYLEVEGREINWDRIWGFDNRYTHSAHNHTAQRRLVFLVDVTRQRLGIEPAVQFDSAARARRWPPFTRALLPPQSHEG